MRVAVVSTYQPRHCGIAVFSGDLRAALLEADSSLAVEIVSLIRGRNPHSHPPEVVATIRQDVASDYRAAAAELDRANVDVVLIEHEYGIFGGNDGQFVLELANQLTMPMVVTLHTVLANPPAGRARTLRSAMPASGVDHGIHRNSSPHGRRARVGRIGARQGRAARSPG